MAMELTQWKYRGTCDEARLRVLQGTIPFEDIVGRLDHEMHLVCCHTPECHDKQGYKRTVYCAEVAHQLFDIFFNSQSGYRGAYFQSPERGLAANSLMLRTVVPRLIAWTRAHCAEQDPEFAAKSLLATSAKAWLAEETLCLCERCEGNGTPQRKPTFRLSMVVGSVIRTCTRYGDSRRRGLRRSVSSVHSSMIQVMNMWPPTRVSGRLKLMRVVGREANNALELTENVASLSHNSEHYAFNLTVYLHRIL